MRVLMRLAIYSLLLAMAASLVGCAPPYGSYISANTGGYKEEKLDDITWRVSYYGNSNTSGDMVWYYWLYRCAELTKAQGYTYFALSKDKKPAEKTSQRQGDSVTYVGWQPADDGSDGLMRVGGHGGGGVYYVPHYTYTTVTTWHSAGIVTLYRTAPAFGSVGAMDAQIVIDQLGEYVKTSGKAKPPTRDAVFDAAYVKLGTGRSPI